MKKTIFMTSIVVLGLFSGCGSNNLNVGEYPVSVRNPIQIPQACETEYEKLKDVPKVAIVKFSNNSNYAVATTTDTTTDGSYKKSSIYGVGIGSSMVGLGHKTKGKVDLNTQKIKRVVDPKLDKAITSALEGMLVELGGADVYSRDDLKKVINEQKLQQNGLFDSNTLVKLGKLTGVQYIITGSIDSVTQQYKNYSKGMQVATQNIDTTKKDATKLVLTKAMLNMFASSVSGMKITTNVTFKVIDVKTGKILFATHEEATTNIGDIPHPTYSQIIGGIKEDIIQALQKAKPQFSKYFNVKGYITQVKTDKSHKNYIAQINLGSKDKVQAGQTFSVYSFDTFIDPISHKTICNVDTLDVKLEVSGNQIQSNYSWTIADGDDVEKLRPGQIIKRDAIKKSLF